MNIGSISIDGINVGSIEVEVSSKPPEGDNTSSDGLGVGNSMLHLASLQQGSDSSFVNPMGELPGLGHGGSAHEGRSGGSHHPPPQSHHGRHEGATEHEGTRPHRSESSDDGEHKYGSSHLVMERSKFAQELKDPKTRERLIQLTESEVGNQGKKARQALMETIVNRAAARGQTLDQTMRPGYYPHQSFHHRNISDEKRAGYDSMIGDVMSGSNVSNYATGNASQSVGVGRQTMSSGGERFGVENDKRDQRFAERMQHAESVNPTRAHVGKATKFDVDAQGNLSPANGPKPRVNIGELSVGDKNGPARELPAPATSNIHQVDPRLREIMGAAATHLPEGYTARVTPHGGYSPTHGDSGSKHRRGEAMDIQIYDPQGNPIRNSGADSSGLYKNLARHGYGEMMARHPELKGRFSWGGAHGTTSGGGPPDLMHYDIGGERGHDESRHPSRMGAVPGEKYGEKIEPTKQAESEDTKKE